MNKKIDKLLEDLENSITKSNINDVDQAKSLSLIKSINEELSKEERMCRITTSVAKYLVKSYWWRTSKEQLNLGIPKEIQSVLAEVGRVSGETFDWNENGVW